MRFWPIIPVISCFFLGMIVAKSSNQRAQIPEPNQVTHAPSFTIRPSILAPRKGTEATRGVLPVNILDKVTFEALVDGKITPIARHTYALSGAQCIAVEAAIAKHQAAIDALDQQLGHKATIVKQTDQETVINLPNNPEARHAINLALWETVQATISSTKAKRVIGGKPEFRVAWHLERTLTLDKDKTQSTVYKATNVRGKRFNPIRSMQPTDSLEHPWKEIVQRLGL